MKRKCSNQVGAKFGKIPNWLKQRELDSLLICRRENVRYFSGFAGSAGVLALTATERKIFVDFRYAEQASQTAPAFQMVRCRANPLEAALVWLKEISCRQIGFEEDFLTIADYHRMTSHIGEECWVPIQLDSLRAVKSEDEIEKIVAAAAIADEALTEILPLIRPGVAEESVAAALEYEMRKRGSTRPAFATIIASGLRAALPHGVASSKKIAPGDFVVIDFGAVYDGYHSDITRTYCVGDASERQKEIYDTVLRAQLAGLNAVKAGALCREVDQAAREIIETAGLGEYFGHGLGHGVGLAIHESPRLSPASGDEKLVSGMIVTVEPGVYLPDWGGVRIEDLVMVTEAGYKRISQMDKALMELA